MALKSLEADWWIELESTYFERLEQRKALYAQHGDTIVKSLPGSEHSCRELMEMVIQFLSIRYPTQFMLDHRTGLFYNALLDTKTDTNTINPLIFLLDNVPEDFLITMPDPTTGLYTLVAGVSCSAVGWSMKSKIGKPLHEIHGPVPDYEERLQFSMDRYFSKMPCNKPIQRGSWSLEIGQPLFMDETDPEFTQHRSGQSPTLDISDIHLRVDWQTLRRLPISRAIIFNFKALFTPVTQFRHEPYIPRLVMKVLEEGNEEIKKYKGTWYVEHVVLPALRLWSKEQEEKGLVERDWEVRTLAEDPFYPGWNVLQH